MEDSTRRIREVFREALERTNVGEQDGFVQQNCAHDPSLQRAVMDLLQADRESEQRGFLEWNDIGVGEAEPDANIGRSVGGYRLIELVGGGATGLVYRAERTDGVHQQVAVKLLRAAHHDPSGLKRFQVEKQALADISHPGIARLISHGATEDGTSFLIMDWIDGERIDHRIERTNPELRTRVEWMLSIARTVAAAHELGILHRDLKPANILITSDDQLRITDFGLAKFMGDARPEMSDLTLTGGLLGTPGYMAPEQLDPHGRQVTPSADIYGLGAVCFYLLTQRPPLRGDSPAEIITAQLRLKAPSPVEFDSSVDRDLETICMKCLEYAPDKRYPSAAAVADDLQLYLAGAPITARPVSGWEHGVRWARRNRLPAALLAATATLAIVAFIAVTGLLLVRNRQARQALAQQQHLFDIVDSTHTEMSKWLAHHPQTNSFRRQLLERAKELSLEVLSLDPTNKQGRVAHATASYRLAKIATHLQDPVTSRAAALEALRKFRELARDYPDELQFQFDVFHCQFLLQDHQAAHDSISHLVEVSDDPYYRDALVASSRRLGDLAKSDDEAQQHFRRAYEISARLAEEFPEDPFFRRHYDQMTLGWRRDALTHDQLLTHAQEALAAADESVESEGNISRWCRTYLDMATTGMLSALVLQKQAEALAIRDHLLNMLVKARQYAPETKQAWVALASARADVAVHALYRSEHDRHVSEALALSELDAALLLWPDDPQLTALRYLFRVEFEGAGPPEVAVLHELVSMLGQRAYCLGPVLVRAGAHDEAKVALHHAPLPHWQIYRSLLHAQAGQFQRAESVLREFSEYKPLRRYKLVQEEVLALQQAANESKSRDFGRGTQGASL